MKTQLGLEEMRTLAEHAEGCGTQDQWIALALEWMEEADAEIKRLLKPPATDGHEEFEEDMDGGHYSLEHRGVK